MTRRDYEILARALHRLRFDAGLEYDKDRDAKAYTAKIHEANVIEEFLAGVLTEDNPRFDAAKFRKAAAR